MPKVIEKALEDEEKNYGENSDPEFGDAEMNDDLQNLGFLLDDFDKGDKTKLERQIFNEAKKSYKDRFENDGLIVLRVKANRDFYAALHHNEEFDTSLVSLVQCFMAVKPLKNFLVNEKYLDPKENLVQNKVRKISAMYSTIYKHVYQTQLIYSTYTSFDI